MCVNRPVQSHTPLPRVWTLTGHATVPLSSSLRLQVQTTQDGSCTPEPGNYSHQLVLTQLTLPRLCLPVETTITALAHVFPSPSAS